jgi:two-component system CheB/CheR fusion protein
MPEVASKDGSENRVDFPIVALCASTGGLQAFQSFFKVLPTGNGMAVIVLQHQMHQRESVLNEIIQRDIDVNVVVVKDGMPIQPNHIFVCPSSHEVTLWNGQFQLEPRNDDTGWPKAIDRLLWSLAEDQGEQVVAVILSGAGTDGTEGARAVRENGGRVVAQEPKSALHVSMPQSVIEANLAGMVLSPEEIPAYLRQVYNIPVKPIIPEETSASSEITEDDLMQVIRRLRTQTSQNFSEYKTSTIQRQITRRMAILQLDSISNYLDYMNQNPEEADHLVRYLLIYVTSFFRDPEAFEALQTDALLPLLNEMDIDTIFRVWVPGCASGEEAISIAILIYECLRELDMLEMEVRIFATDANRNLIRQAREGLYPLSIAEEMSEDRLQNYFVQEDASYRVRNHLLRMLIWSEHNLVEHPPFSQLHLISCRNVLIYFRKRLQDRVLSLFQFALRPNGILFLGSSETMTFSSNDFATVNSKYKIYRQVSGTSQYWLRLDQPLFKRLPETLEKPMTDQNLSRRTEGEYRLQVIKDLLVEHVGATCLLVDENYMVQYSLGEVDRYLQFISGDSVPRTVLEQAREGLGTDLTVALHQAFNNDEDIVQRQDVWVRTNGNERIIDLTVVPVRDRQLGNRVKLAILELKMEGRDLRNLEMGGEVDGDDPDIINAHLRRELQEMKVALHSTTQALQAKSEELTTSMEEIRSANEEVQTTNEELRTSKEELESMNEELNTLNTQLTNQNNELTRANDTLHNFLQSAEVGMIFLNQDLAVREYTRSVTTIFSLRPEDRGRALAEIATQLDYSTLADDADKVLETLENVEKEVLTRDGQWYNVRIHPYRTTSNVIDGLVLTFSEVTTQKQAQLKAEQQVSYVRQVMDTVGDGIIELDDNLRVIAVNQPFLQMFQVDAHESVGRQVYDLGNGQWDIPDLRRLLYEVIPKQTIVRDYEVRHTFPNVGQRTMSVNARQVAELNRILLVITDISEETD